MNAKNFACVRKKVVEVGEPLEESSFCVRDLSDGAKGDENGNLALEDR